MSLHEALLKATSEEDVKAAYIKALGLKNVQRNLIDIQTKEIWFEAKLGARHSTYFMFTQLLNYVWVALRDGESVPPFLCVVDSVKAALMKTEVALPLLKDKSANIKWGKSASDVTPEALNVISQYIGTHFVSFRIETQEREFIDTVKAAIKSGEIIRTQITPDNLKQVFDRWVDMIGREITDVAEDEYALLFFADVMSDGTVSTHENLSAELIHRNGRPAFLLEGRVCNLGSLDGYHRFWAIYDRPPKEEYRNYLLERRDSLIPYDERAFKGAFYTPLHIVDKAYDLLTQLLGKNWQRDYIVVDMCCGVGNLETKHSNPRNVFMSTLDQPDLDVMAAAKTCRAATRFQYDYLNDDIAEDGSIDYTITNKMPQSLRDVIAAAKEGKKKILVLINPPYAEAGNGSGKGDKEGVSNLNHISKGMENFGFAKRELFIQFLYRITKEMPSATVAMFSKLKYVNAPNFAPFRDFWRAKYLGGFVVHSKAFDGLKGDFPIGFLVWQTGDEKFPSSISCDVLDRYGSAIGEKTFYSVPEGCSLNDWVVRPRANKVPSLPLKNAVSPATKTVDVRGDYWADGAIGSFVSKCNDFQHAAQETALFSSGYCNPGAFYVTAENLEKVAVMFTVRRIVKPTWLNDRDQFLIPEVELTGKAAVSAADGYDAAKMAAFPVSGIPDEFKLDCLIYMLFNNSNLTASADGLEWNEKKWSIVNHFIPFTEEEVDAPGRFESDFMVRYLENVKLCKCENMEVPNTQLDVGCFHNSTIPHFHNRSPEASAVLSAGREIWRAYFRLFPSFDYSIRERLKLNRPDVGWYQIRQALKLYGESSEGRPTDFTQFNAAYSALSEKLRPMVYSLGFLK